MATTGINLFAPSYFVRGFGLGIRDVGLLYGLVIGGSMAAGMLAGASAPISARDATPDGTPSAGDGPGDRRAASHGCLQSEHAGAGPALHLCRRADMSFMFGPTFAVVQNMVEPRMRASAVALMLLSMNVIGQGIGPLVMGWASRGEIAVARSRAGGPA
jgi:hypothetical protein